MRSIFLIIFLLPLQIWANPYGKKSGRWQFDLKSEFLTTSENIDSSGDVVDLANSGEYSETKNRVKLEWDTSDATTLISELVVNSYEASSTSISSSNTAPTDLYLGFEHTLSDNNMRVTPRLLLRIPLETYGDNVAEAFGNNNSYDIDARMYLSSQWENVMLSAYAGFTYRTAGLSSLLPFGAELLYHSRSFSLGGGFESSYSILADEDEDDDPVRLAVLQQSNVGSFRYYSVNPSLTSAYAFAKVYFSESFYVGGEYKQTLFGKNAHYGTTISALLGFNFGGSNADYLKKLKKTKTQKRKRKFRYKFDEAYDEDEDVFNRRGKIRYRQEKEESLDDLEKDFEIQLKKKND